MPIAFHLDGVLDQLLENRRHGSRPSIISQRQKGELTIFPSKEYKLFMITDNRSKEVAVVQMAHVHLTETVRAVHVSTRQNPIVNRLNKTKVEKQVDHEQERIDRIKAENAAKRSAANAKVRFTFVTLLIQCTGPYFFGVCRRKQTLSLLAPEKQRRQPGLTTPFSMGKWTKMRSRNRGRLGRNLRKTLCESHLTYLSTSR